jgi:hypothetical protein
MIVRCSIHIPRRLDLLRLIIAINVPHKDCATSVIHEGFDPIPDMGRSIAARILVMRDTEFGPADFLKHIGPTLNLRHLSFER